MRRKKSNASNTGGKGATRMREFGYKAVTIWLDASERAMIEEAAAKAGQRVASWVRRVAVEAAGGRYVDR